MKDKNYITPTGFQNLRAEYQQLLNGERPRVVETVAWAASNGDRSENADYIYGKRRLREIDRRLKFLTERLEAAEIVNPLLTKSDRVLFGATVTISDLEGKEITYQIVGEDELDPKAGKISWRSPIAKALLGKRPGEEVQVHKPSGLEVIVIESLEYK
ncbi:MAG: transcription elongation factor GreB [Bdellovibrionaceae bacterium]|nr:transcription elongation factor GreB [Pseudobdellovibrionaceae bacterium]